MSQTSSVSSPRIYRNDRAPEWGMGAIVGENEGKIVLVFEDGGLRTFKTAMLNVGLTAVELPTDDARALNEKLRGRKRSGPATLAEKKKRSAKAAKTAAAKLAKASFESFEAELAVFQEIFPEGFTDPRFLSEERGNAESTGKDGLKEAGIAIVQKELSAERFAQATPEELFDSAKRAIQTTNIAFPIEGVIPFRAIEEGDRAPMLEALKELLHGTGDYGTRLEQFAQSLKFKDKTGKVKPATWPIVTLLPALHQPTEHVAIKPTAFASQAALFGEEVQKTQPVSGAGYKSFLKVAVKTREKLLAAGHKPRDLMDVYSFIFRVHSQKKPATATA